jgi:hypothetical protein
MEDSLVERRATLGTIKDARDKARTQVRAPGNGACARPAVRACGASCVMLALSRWTAL